MATQYSIVFVNNSTKPGAVCLYQQPDDFLRNMNEIKTLAWFTKRTNPGTKARFAWNPDYCFIWDDLIDSEPGSVVDASQTVACDLNEKNGITLSKVNDAYRFGEPMEMGQPGMLMVRSDSTVPAHEAVAGYGLAGSGLFVVPVLPNYNVVFRPMQPNRFFITFGDFQTGQVLDLEAITENSAEVAFPGNIYSMVATLNADDTWTIKQNHTLLSEEG